MKTPKKRNAPDATLRNTQAVNRQHDRRYRTARIARPAPMGTFSYYGGKSKIAARYPVPRYPLIIEPFGGAGAYAWQHRRRACVWINDLDAVTFAIWQFLQSPDVNDVLATLPRAILPGQPIGALVPPGAHPGLDPLLRAELSRGNQGRRDTPGRATAFGALYYWPRLAARVRYVAAAIRDWRITNEDYRALPNQAATWFIDPPYDNAAGRRYRCADLDYDALGAWTRGREGQVIACENTGATWLPFRPLTKDRIGRQPKTTNLGEAMWESEPQPELFR